MACFSLQQGREQGERPGLHAVHWFSHSKTTCWAGLASHCCQELGQCWEGQTCRQLSVTCVVSAASCLSKSIFRAARRDRLMPGARAWQGGEEEWPGPRERGWWGIPARHRTDSRPVCRALGSALAELSRDTWRHLLKTSEPRFPHLWSGARNPVPRTMAGVSRALCRRAELSAGPGQVPAELGSLLPAGEPRGAGAGDRHRDGAAAPGGGCPRGCGVD